MKYLLPYIAVRFASWIIHTLSFGVISNLSKALAFVLLYVIRYRRETALANLAKCFPERHPSEHKKLLPAIYLNLCDVFLETVKAFHLPPTSVLKNIQLPSTAQLEHFHQNFRGAILVTAHISNWEWCGFVMSEVLKEDGIAVYRPLKNPRVDAMMKGHRKRSAMHIIPMREIVRWLSGGKAKDHFVLLIADQSPDPDNAQWDTFFGIQTAFFKGPATLAVRYDLPVFFVHLERTRRHHYAMHLYPLCLEPQTSDVASITHAYVQRLEALIRKKPAEWLWTHRRWKHEPPDLVTVKHP